MIEKKPENPVSKAGSTRVRRGGNWNEYPSPLRPAERHAYYPSRRINYGFRLARTKK